MQQVNELFNDFSFPRMFFFSFDVICINERRDKSYVYSYFKMTSDLQIKK